jgi:uncharacterized membrane protein (UPF0127 family)
MLKGFLLIFFLCFETWTVTPDKLQKSKLAMMNGRMISVFLAVTDKEQNDGLSGWKPTQLAQDQGMLFLYKNHGIRSFWMPNTFFNLDIIYLDQNFKVLKIDRNAQHHPSYNEPVPRLSPTFAHHVLEIHANSELSKQIKVGTQFKWMGKKSVTEILRGTRQ